VSYGLVGLYGLFLLFVGIRGNAAKLTNEIGTDFHGFMPWLVAILILRALYNVEGLKPAIKPFIALALLTFVLKNYNTVAAQVDTITGSHFSKATK
jgi:hypothetical protein